MFVFLGGGLVSRSMSFGMFLFGVIVFVLGSWVFFGGGFFVVFFVGGFLFLVICGGGGGVGVFLWCVAVPVRIWYVGAGEVCRFYG